MQPLRLETMVGQFKQLPEESRLKLLIYLNYHVIGSNSIES